MYHALTMQATDVADKIAGDDPLLWLLLAGLGIAGITIKVLWSAYTSERDKRTLTLEKSITAITEANMARSADKSDHERNHSDIIERLSRIEASLARNNT